jgi:NAD(P)H dehydrogenase (quinone)
VCPLLSGAPAFDLLPEQSLAAPLTDMSLFDGITAPLTGALTYTFADMARLCSDVLGREVMREVTTDDVYRQNALGHGYPEPMVGMLISMFEAMRDGEFNVVDPTLERVLGRRPTELKQVLAPSLASSSLPAGASRRLHHWAAAIG